MDEATLRRQAQTCSDNIRMTIRAAVEDGDEPDGLRVDTDICRTVYAALVQFHEAGYQQARRGSPWLRFLCRIGWHQWGPWERIRNTTLFGRSHSFSEIRRCERCYLARVKRHNG